MNEQIEVLKAIYSRPNELVYDEQFDLLIYNAFDDQRQTIGFSVKIYSLTMIRIESQILDRNELKQLESKANLTTDYYDLFTNLKNFYEELMMKRTKEVKPVQECSSTILLKIDHMRSPNVYLKHLRQWTDELGITGRVLVVPHDIFILIEGMNDTLKKLIIKLKTETVDIDSRGRPCKERLLTQMIELHHHPSKFTSFEKLEFSHRNDLTSYLIESHYDQLLDHCQ